MNNKLVVDWTGVVIFGFITGVIAAMSFAFPASSVGFSGHFSGVLGAVILAFCWSRWCLLDRWTVLTLVAEAPPTRGAFI